MLNYIKKDLALYIILILFLSLIGLGVMGNVQSISNTIILVSGGIGAIFFAFFYPTLFCYLLIFIAPLSISIPDIGGGTALSLPAEGMLGLLLLLTFIKLFAGIKIKKEILWHPITIILLLDIAWMVITSITSTMPEVSFKRIILKISFILGFYLIFSHLFDKPKNQLKLFVLYSIGLIIPIFNALLNHSTYNFSQEESFEMTEPFYEDHTLYGACLAFILPFLILYTIHLIKTNLYQPRTYFFIFLSLLVTIGEVLSFSRAAWISVIMAFGVYGLSLIKIKPRVYLTILTIGTIVLVSQFDTIYKNIKLNDAKKSTDDVEQHLGTVTDLKSNASNLERINRWVCAYRMFEKKPIFGWGPGTYQFNYAQFQTNEFTTEISSNNGDRGNSHSEYFTLLSEEGLIALILFILLIIVTFSQSIGALNTITDPLERVILYGFLLGLITFFTHGFFNTFSDFEKMSILVYGSLAGIVSILVNRQKGSI